MIRLGQDILPLSFKLFPQRSESVDNSNRLTPTHNPPLQRVCQFDVISMQYELIYRTNFRISLSKTSPILCQLIWKRSIFNPFRVHHFVSSDRRAINQRRNFQQRTKYDENERRKLTDRWSHKKSNDVEVK